MSKIRVIIAGGGTGGHFFPAIAIGDELKSRGTDVMYIGSHYGIEAEKLNNKKDSKSIIWAIKIIENSLLVFEIFI